MCNHQDEAVKQIFETSLQVEKKNPSASEQFALIWSETWRCSSSPGPRASSRLKPGKRKTQIICQLENLHNVLQPVKNLHALRFWHRACGDDVTAQEHVANPKKKKRIERRGALLKIYWWGYSALHKHGIPCIKVNWLHLPIYQVNQVKSRTRYNTSECTCCEAGIIHNHTKTSRRVRKN